MKIIERLSIQNNGAVVNINGFKNLRMLNASRKFCRLSTIGIEDLQLLEKLYICENKNITNINCLENLKELNICDKLQINNDDIDDLGSVEIIYVNEKINIDKLDISKLNFLCGYRCL